MTDNQPKRIGVGLDRPGMETFFGGWVVPGPPCVVVDVGPPRGRSAFPGTTGRPGRG